MAIATYFLHGMKNKANPFYEPRYSATYQNWYQYHIQVATMLEQLDGDAISYFTGLRILVTGASGYLATNLIHHLKDVECRIIRLSRSSTLFSVEGRAEIVDLNGDIGSEESWQLLDDVDIIYHLAAQTSVYAAADNPFSDLEANVMPMLRLLEKCRRQSLRPIVVFAGTSTEVGIPDRLPANETYQDLPVTIYDLHKLAAENYLKYYSRQGFVRGTVLRLTNVYGPGPKSSQPDRGVVNIMMRKALAGEALTVFGKGDCVRDYIYVDDVISAFLQAAASINALNERHFLIGSGQGHTISEAFNLIADRVALKTGKRVPVKHIDPPSPQSAIESRNFIADTSMFSRATGWRAYHSLSDGIDKTLASYL
jgi:UDP-glucose 4-epimerase